MTIPVMPHDAPQTLETFCTLLDATVRDDPDVTVRPGGRLIRFWIVCEEHCPLTYLLYRTTAAPYLLTYAAVAGTLLGLTPPDITALITAADRPAPSALRTRLLRARRRVWARQEDEQR